MDRPFFYPSPWSYYCPPPPSRRASRVQAWPFLPPPDLAHNRSPVLSHPRRTPSRAHSAASTAPSLRHSRQTSITPSPLPAARSRMPRPAFSNPFTNPNPNTSTTRPSPSFSRCASDLYTTVDDALTYIEDLYTSFRTETLPIRRYADPNVLDAVWQQKILSGPTPDPNTNPPTTTTSPSPPMDLPSLKARHAATFADHQIGIRNRCLEILRAIPTPHRRQLDDGSPSPLATETQALVTKLGRVTEDLMPSLGAMGKSYAAVGTAIKEIKVLRQNLDTYREVWSEEGREEDQNGNNEGYGPGGGGSGRRR